MTDSANPRSREEKFVTLFEGAKRSLLAAEELHRRLAADLLAIEPDLDAGLDIGGKAIPPLLSAISFVDFSHRFGSLVDALPKVNKDKYPELRHLQQTLKPVEQARNHLQHLRGDLNSNAPITYALLGELGWSHENRVYFIALTDPHQVNHATIAFTLDGHFSAKHRYIIKDVWIDVDPIAESMRRAFELIASKVEFNDPDFGKLQWGKTIGGTFRVMLNLPPLADPLFRLEGKPASDRSQDMPERTIDTTQLDKEP